MRTLIIAAYLGLTWSALAQTVTFSDIEGQIRITPPTVYPEGIARGIWTVTNLSDYDLRNIQMNCFFRAPNGSVVKSIPQTIYQDFPARQTRTTVEISIGYVPDQSANLNCDPVDGTIITRRPPPAVSSFDDPSDKAERWKTCDCDNAEPLSFDGGHSRLPRPRYRPR